MNWRSNDELYAFFFLPFDAASWAVSVYYAYQRAWKPFNPILGETYEMVNHGGVTFISEQVSHLMFYIQFTIFFLNS